MSNWGDLLDDLDGEAKLTTGEAARLLGVSRQHIVDLCDRGLLPYEMVGSHRRIRLRDATRAVQDRTRMSRDQRRSLWLAHAVAGELVARPDPVIRHARQNLLHAQVKGAAKWNAEWQRLLDGPIEQILAALTSPSLRSRELRQNSPFAGVLSEERRREVLESFASRSKP
jgi:excisionase family DNA binding protein